MTNDVSFAKLSMKEAIGIGTAERGTSSDIHTCLMTEEVREIQEYSQVAALPVIINNTCRMKHPKSNYRAAPTFDFLRPSDILQDSDRLRFHGATMRQASTIQRALGSLFPDFPT
jgi:hypothetical protein